MAYRIVKITSFYNDFLKHYYLRNKNVVYLSYEIQYEHLMQQAFGWSDYFQKNFTEQGLEAFEIIFNAIPLQSAWAKENGFQETGLNLLTQQLKVIKPDIVFFQDSTSFSGGYIKSIKDQVPSVKQVIGMCCYPISPINLINYSFFDYMIACSPQFTDIFQKNNIKCYELNHGFEHTLLPQIQSNNQYKNEKISFIGSFIQSQEFHDERLNLIEFLLDEEIDLTIYTDLRLESSIKLLSKQSAYVLTKFLKSIGLKDILFNLPLIKKVALLNEMPKKYKYTTSFRQKINSNPLYGLEMMKALAKSQIGLNIHGGVAGDYAANVRMFEVTGVGSCLVTDNKKNMKEFFEPDKEVVVYSSFDECKEKLNWLLDHPVECDAIGKAGQNRTLKDHTYKIRVEKLDKIIRKELGV